MEILDESADNYSQRIKRHEFYKRCGLDDFPYHLKEMTQIYQVMGIGNPVEPAEYKEMIDNYLGWPLEKLIDMRFVE